MTAVSFSDPSLDMIKNDPAPDLGSARPAPGCQSLAAPEMGSLAKAADARARPVPDRRINRDGASDRQSRTTISRLLHAQPRRVVWDLPQQSVLRLRAQTCEKHVAKSDEELLNVLRRNYTVGVTADWFQEAEGSFADVSSARDFVNQVLEQNRASVDFVTNGHLPEAVLHGDFPCVTGREAYRSSYHSAPVIRDTHSARVVIKQAFGTEHGYRIHTAFPSSQCPKRRSDGRIKVPHGFDKLAERFYQGSHEEFASENEWMAAAVGALCGEEKQVVREFLGELLGGRYSDLNIGQIWRGAAADYGFSAGGHRIFLSRISEIIGLVLCNSFL